MDVAVAHLASPDRAEELAERLAERLGDGTGGARGLAGRDRRRAGRPRRPRDGRGRGVAAYLSVHRAPQSSRRSCPQAAGCVLPSRALGFLASGHAQAVTGGGRGGGPSSARAAGPRARPGGADGGRVRRTARTPDAGRTELPDAATVPPAGRHLRPPRPGAGSAAASSGWATRCRRRCGGGSGSSPGPVLLVVALVGLGRDRDRLRRAGAWAATPRPSRAAAPASTGRPRPVPLVPAPPRPASAPAPARRASDGERDGRRRREGTPPRGGHPAGRLAGRRRAAAGRRCRGAGRPQRASTWPGCWSTASRSWSAGRPPGGLAGEREHGGARMRPGALVNLNTATGEQLDTLPGRRAGDGPEDPRLARGPRRVLLGRRAARGRRHR